MLIIDDLGLRPLIGEEPLDLYEIIRCRYERGSMIITSNRDLDEWPPLFNDALLGRRRNGSAAAPSARDRDRRRVLRNPKTRGKRAA